MAALSKRTYYRLSTALVVMLAMGLGSCAAPDPASAQAPPPPPMQGPPPAPPAAYWQAPTGPFKVVMEEDDGLPEHHQRTGYPLPPTDDGGRSVEHPDLEQRSEEAGRPLVEAFHEARAYLDGAIRHAPGLGSGAGPLDHFWRHRP